MLAAGLALAASLSWGIADFLAGVRSRRLPLLAVLVLVQSAGLVSIAAVVAVRAEPPPGAAHVVYAALAGVAGAVGLAALYRGLAVGAMGVVAPIAATGAVVPVVAGIATGERLSTAQALGIVVALGGVVLAARQPGEPGAGTWIAAGVAPALLAALAFGLLLVALDAGAEADALWATLVLRTASWAIVAAAALVARPALPVTRSDAAALAVVGVLDTGANALFAAASTRGLLSVVSVLGQLYPIATVLLARLVLRERLARVQQAGVVGAFAGVALITAG